MKYSSFSFITYIFIILTCIIDQLKKNQQLIRRSMREIERERNKLQLNEKKLIIDIKKNAKMGQMV